jgi:hypothetical protein
VITSIQYALKENHKELAPCLWLTLLGVISLIGSAGLCLYKPQLNKPHVARLA